MERSRRVRPAGFLPYRLPGPHATRYLIYDKNSHVDAAENMSLADSADALISVAPIGRLALRAAPIRFGCSFPRDLPSGKDDFTANRYRP